MKLLATMEGDAYVSRGPRSRGHIARRAKRTNSVLRLPRTHSRFQCGVPHTLRVCRLIQKPCRKVAARQPRGSLRAAGAAPSPQPCSNLRATGVAPRLVAAWQPCALLELQIGRAIAWQPCALLKLRLGCATTWKPCAPLGLHLGRAATGQPCALLGLRLGHATAR